jgi:hypothetical protein
MDLGVLVLIVACVAIVCAAAVAGEVVNPWSPENREKTIVILSPPLDYRPELRHAEWDR